MHKLLAQAVLKSAEMQQMSYDLTASALATAEYDRKYAEFMEANPGGIYYGCVDYKQFYTITLEEACEKCSPPGVGRLVYLALESWWNDTIEWANAVLDPTATTIPTLEHCQHGTEYHEIDPQAPEGDDKPFCELCKANYARCKSPAWMMESNEQAEGRTKRDES
jgi:hypothetical protein